MRGVVLGEGVLCEMCICLAGGGVGGEWVRGLGKLGLVILGGDVGEFDVCWCLVWGGVGGVGGECRRGLELAKGKCGEVYVAWGSLDSLCRWHIHVSVYWSTRICAHLRCTQCSEWLHLSDVCFLVISLWQISQIQTCVRVCFGPGFVSTSPAFDSSCTSQPAGPLGRPAQKPVETGPHCGGQEEWVQFVLRWAATVQPCVGCTLLDRYLFVMWFFLWYWHFYSYSTQLLVCMATHHWEQVI